MGTSARVPPGNDLVPEGEEDELDMTSIMDAEQRRALQKAARTGKGEAAKREAEPEEQQRPTARPPPGAAAVAEGELAIPKPQPVPAEARLAPAEAPAQAAGPGPRAARTPPGGSRSFDTLSAVAFVLLAVAVAFALSR
jgi:hypothetical protein